MEEHQTFGQRRWPLHFALAWVLTRDPAFSERAKPSDFHPHLNEDEDEDDWISGDEVDQAWSLLHQALAGGSVPAFKTSKLCGNSDAQVGEAGEERIAPEALASIDWADLIRDDGDSSAVVVSSSAMISFFPPGGNPVAFTSDHIGPPIRPDGPGYMALSDAAYWIATEGGTKRIVMRDVSVWKGAFAELLRRVQSGQVHVVGRRGGASLPETIDGASFVGLPIGYPYTQAPLSMITGKKPYIECWVVLFPETDEADQYSDKLWGFNRHTPEWTHLQVQCSDIHRGWPFSEPDAEDAANHDVQSGHKVRRQNSKVQAIRQAVNEIWPTGIPPGLHSTDRARKINEWLKNKGLREASNRSIIRALTRK